MTRKLESEEGRRDISGRTGEVEVLQRPTLPSLPTEKSHQREIMTIASDELKSLVAAVDKSWSRALKGALIVTGLAFGVGLYFATRGGDSKRKRSALH